MEIGKYSRNRLLKTFQEYHVPQEIAQSVYDYLVNGFHPGGFYSAVMANDFVGAMMRSHPLNDIPSLKHLSTWMGNNLQHGIAWGSRQAVENWLSLTDDERKTHLANWGLVYTQEDEVMLILKDAPYQEITLY